MARIYYFLRQPWLKINREDETVLDTGNLVQKSLYSSIIQSKNVSNFIIQRWFIQNLPTPRIFRPKI